MKVWNIKYCLTSGITHVTVDGTLLDKYVYTQAEPDRFIYSSQLKVGRDAFETFDEAFVAAEKLRERRIASLKRKIAELEKMSFRKPGKK